jgi:hypothetical protein
MKVVQPTISLAAIAGLVVLEIVAIRSGMDGVLFSAVVALIGLIAGVNLRGRNG